MFVQGCIPEKSPVCGANVRQKFRGKSSLNPGPLSLECACLSTRVQWKADGHRCINSVLVNVLTKGEGGAILPMEGRNIEEMRKIKHVTNRM